MWSGSLVALVTPFLDDGSIDFDAFDGLIALHITSGTSAIVLLGSTGEAALLEDNEKEQLVVRACREINGAIPLIVGVSSPSTAMSVAFGGKALALGADALMATPPYYVNPGLRGTFAHFEAIDQLRAPLMIYNHPGRTGINLSAENLCALSSLDSVVAIKESGGGSAVCGTTPVFCGDDHLVKEMRSSGSAGSVSVIANAYPKEWSSFVKGDEPCPFDDLVTALSKVPNPVGIKYLMSLLGLCTERVRLPLVPLTADEKVSIEVCLDALQK